MPDLPWELLASRLERFLQRANMYAVLAGLILISYWWAPSLGNSPAERRDAVAAWLYDVTHPQTVDILSTLLTLIVGLLACYVVGLLIRTLTFRVTSAVYLVVVNGFYRTRAGRAWTSWRLSGEPVVTRDFSRRTVRTELNLPGSRVMVPAWVGTGVETLQHVTSWGLREPPKRAWSSLVHLYGEERLRAALRPHPIDVAKVENGDLGAYWDYCTSWLRKYEPDEVIMPRASRYLAASTLLVPTVLLAEWSRRYLGDLTASQMIEPLAPWVFLYFLYVVLGLRGTQIDPASMFRRFVVVQLVEQSRDDTDRPSADEQHAAARAATKRAAGQPSEDPG